MASVKASTGLLEELRADQPTGTGCSVCNFLSTRPEPEQAEWAEAMRDRSYSIPALHRALKKRGYKYTESPIKTHRNHVAA